MISWVCRLKTLPIFWRNRDIKMTTAPLTPTLVKNIKKHNKKWGKQIIPLLECKQDRLKNKGKLDIGDYKFCIVGEVHKFKNYYSGDSSDYEKNEKYYCNECCVFAGRLDTLADNISEANEDMSIDSPKVAKKKFAKELERFYKHFDKEHIK